MENCNFNSLDKLLEFGMSMAVAQQMMQTMNNAMNQMQTPQFNSLNMNVPKPMLFYALVNDIPQGPFTEDVIISHIIANRINKVTMVWFNGLPGWMQAEQVPEVNKLFALVPPPLK
jgi:hypothetical protein